MLQIARTSTGTEILDTDHGTVQGHDEFETPGYTYTQENSISKRPRRQRSF